MTAIGYRRVSTEDQAKEGVSLDVQKSKIEAYCKLKDSDLSKIIEDAGITDALETTKSFDKWGVLFHSIEETRTRSLKYLKGKCRVGSECVGSWVLADNFYEILCLDAKGGQK